jgi:hypothetical protein
MALRWPLIKSGVHAIQTGLCGLKLMVNGRWYKGSSIYSTLILYSTMNADAGVTKLTNGKNANAGLLFPSHGHLLINFLHQIACIQYISSNRVWACRVYPFPYLNFGRAKCILFHNWQKNAHAGCIHFNHQQYWSAWCIPSTTSSIDVQGVSLPPPVVWTCKCKGVYPFLPAVQTIEE